MKGEYDALAACGNHHPSVTGVSLWTGLEKVKYRSTNWMKECQFLPVVISRPSGKSMQILEGNWGKDLKVSLTMWKCFTRKLSQTQGLGSEISRLLGLFLRFFFKHWNATPGEGGRWIWESWWSFSGAIQISWRWKSQLQKLLHFVLFTSGSPPTPKKKTVFLGFFLYILRRISCSSFLKLAIFSPPFPFGVDFFEVTWNIRIWWRVWTSPCWTKFEQNWINRRRWKRFRALDILGCCVRFLRKGWVLLMGLWRVNLVPPELQVMHLDR